MLKEIQEQGPELLIDEIAAKAKELFLRDNYLTPMLFFSGSKGSKQGYASPSWHEMRESGREAAKIEFSIGALSNVVVVFRGFYGRLGSEGNQDFDLGDDPEGFSVLRLMGGPPGANVGFSAWADKLKEVLVIAGLEVSVNKTDAIIMEIKRDEAGETRELSEVFRGNAESSLLQAFAWGYSR